MNLYGVRAIYFSELSRMWRTLFQSVASPVISTSLYFIVFGAAIGSRISEIDGIVRFGTDVVLVDLVLPGMSGVEGIRLLRERCPEVAPVVFTVFEEDEQVFDALIRAGLGLAGIGLGLSFARAIARAHGGDITVTSEVGVGSTFTITLPPKGL